VRRYASDATLREAAARRNRAYLDEHENGYQQAIGLLERVRAICDRYES
jgi:hypothetical protein